MLTNGIFVGMNRFIVHLAIGSPPHEVNILSFYDVTAASMTSGSPTTANSYSYALGTSGAISWTAASADAEGVTPCYKVSVTINGNTTDFVTCGTSTTINAAPGQTASVVIQTVNPNDNSKTGPTSNPTLIKFIDPNADQDSDGQINSAEDQAGTNPFDATSVLKLTSLTEPDANNLTLTWQSVPGKKYQVQSAASPGGSYFPASPLITAVGSTTSRTVTLADNTFYRVALCALNAVAVKSVAFGLQTSQSDRQIMAAVFKERRSPVRRLTADRAAGKPPLEMRCTNSLAAPKSFRG